MADDKAFAAQYLNKIAQASAPTPISSMPEQATQEIPPSIAAPATTQALDVNTITPQVLTPEQGLALQKANAMEEQKRKEAIAAAFPDLATLPGPASQGVINTGPDAVEMNMGQIPESFAPPQAPEAPFESKLLPDDLAKLAVDQTAAIASQPSTEDISAAINRAMAPERQANAAKLALDEVDKMRSEAERRQQAREDEAAKKFQEISNRARTMSIPEIYRDGSFGQKLGATIAIMLGGVAQGLQGQKTNPVVDFMNTVADQQAAKDKLSLEEKQALQHELYQQGQLELGRLEQATNNAYRKDAIRQQQAELAARQAQLRQQMLMQFAKNSQSDYKYSGKALTPEQYASLTAEDRRSVVTLQDGRRVMASNPTDAREFQKFATEVTTAINAAKELKSLANQVSKLDVVAQPLKYRELQKRADVLKQVMVGALRLPFTGPGVLTDTERAQLIDTIGSPLDILAVKSWELQKLDQVQKSLEGNLQSTATARGVLEPLTEQKFYQIGGKAYREDDLTNLYLQKYPQLDKDKILKMIRTQVAPL